MLGKKFILVLSFCIFVLTETADPKIKVPKQLSATEISSSTPVSKKDSSVTEQTTKATTKIETFATTTTTLPTSTKLFTVMTEKSSILTTSLKNTTSTSIRTESSSTSSKTLASNEFLQAKESKVESLRTSGTWKIQINLFILSLIMLNLF